MLITINSHCFKKNIRAVDVLRKNAEKYKVPFNLLFGIYIMETTFRRGFFRLAENSATILGILKNICFGSPVKNYTIGRCQVGLTSILIFYGYDNYNPHSLYVQGFNFYMLMLVFKSMFYKTNIEVFSKKVALYYNHIVNLSPDNAIILTGEFYNGKFSYGLALERIVNDLNFINISNY